MPSAFDGQLPNDWDDCRHCHKSQRIDHNGLCRACAGDLQLWIRHGRVGIGRTYEQEVERAKKIEAERASVSPA